MSEQAAESEEKTVANTTVRLRAFRDHARSRFSAVISALRQRFAMLYVHYFVRVDERDKCPGCGTRAKHEIKFVRAYAKLIHNCKFCGAVWATDPLVPYTQWEVKGLEDVQQPAAQAEDRAYAASREPIVLRQRGNS